MNNHFCYIQELAWNFVKERCKIGILTRLFSALTHEKYSHTKVTHSCINDFKSVVNVLKTLLSYLKFGNNLNIMPIPAISRHRNSLHRNRFAVLIGRARTETLHNFILVFTHNFYRLKVLRSIARYPLAHKCFVQTHNNLSIAPQLN